MHNAIEKRRRIPFGPCSLLFSAAGFVCWRLPYTPYLILLALPILALLSAVIAGLRGARLWFLAVLLPAFLLVIFVSDNYLNLRRETFYTSLADADKDRAIERGWIPEFLPESSRRIHELHYIDGSKTWCAFEFLPADSQDLRKNLKSVGALPPSLSGVRHAHVLWWPAMLEGNVDIEKIRKAGFELYMLERPATKVDTEVLLFAIDWPKGRAFFYRTHRPSS